MTSLSSRLRTAVPELDDDAIEYFEGYHVTDDVELSAEDVLGALRVLYDAATAEMLATRVCEALGVGMANSASLEAPPPLAAAVCLVEPTAAPATCASKSKYALEGSWGTLDALKALERKNAGSTEPETVTSAELLAATFVADPIARKAAVKELCPCHVRKDVPEFWARIAEMAVNDVDAGVRAQAMHDLCDGSPPWMEDKVLECLRELEHDADPAIRKKARMVLTSYRYEGKWNVM
eukprot:Amastigsp_a842558_127.p1 type:complete len:237 gc:universal Amastigsp_a842558_127:729-19(-)